MLNVLDGIFLSVWLEQTSSVGVVKDKPRCEVKASSYFRFQFP